MDKQQSQPYPSTKIFYLKDQLYETFMIEALILECGDLRNKGNREFREVLVGDETGMINLIVKGEECHYVQPMDIILIEKGYAFPDKFGNGLKLCYGDNGKIQKIGEFTLGVYCDINLSKGDGIPPSQKYEGFSQSKFDNAAGK